MSEQQGFTTDQLVVYKLGQIESQLNGIRDELRSFVKDQADQDARIEKLSQRQTNLETSYKVDKARVLTLAGVVAVFVSIAKGFLEKWIGLHLPT